MISSNDDTNVNSDKIETKGQKLDALDDEINAIKQSIEEYTLMNIPEETDSQKENDLLLTVNEF